MDKHIEKEYKVLLSKVKFFSLYTMYNMPTFRTQINTYFDTLDLTLQKQKSVMRIRKIDETYLFTLKTWDNEDLYEYECPVNGNTLQDLETDEVKEVLASLNILGPFQVLTTLITKRAVIITDEYELCFDESTYNGITDYEIEYEYKIEHDGLAKFNKILSGVDEVYTSNAASKIMRALNSMK